MDKFQPNPQRLGLLLGMIKSERTTADIMRILGCSRSTDMKYRRIEREHPNEFLSDGRINNRARESLTPEEVANIELLSDELPFMPATKIRNELLLICHVRTIRRAMGKKIDIHCFKLAKKNKFIPLHKQQRLDFARRHLNLTEAEWQKTIFLDEKVFSTHTDLEHHV
ncbi:hypothetical protein TKK_0000615 [Trichogramma kaykai]